LMIVLANAHIMDFLVEKIAQIWSIN
jgi:hypothetical protein